MAWVIDFSRKGKAISNERTRKMPIYEFKCLKCNEFFELLVMNKDEEVALSCPKCSSEEFERVLSSTSFAMREGGNKQSNAASQTRNCSSGSCTTYTIPGPNG